MKIDCENAIENMKKLDDSSMNLIYCDPPYNLGTIWQIGEDGKVIPKGSNKEFMSKDWAVDWEEFFKQAYRILKFGGQICLFSIDRQTLPFEYYAVKANFEICQHIYHFQIQSMPKSLNVSRKIDQKLGCEREKKSIPFDNDSQLMDYKGTNSRPWKKEALEKGYHEMDGDVPVSDLAKEFQGYKSGVAPLKQALEVLLIFRKKLKTDRFADDILLWKEGDKTITPSVLNIGNSRIKYESENDIIPQIRNNKKKVNAGKMCRGNSLNQSRTKAVIGGTTDGRYPSNLFIQGFNEDHYSKILEIKRKLLDAET